MTSFYLAGKISKNGWRYEIVDGLRDLGPTRSEEVQKWSIKEKVIFNTFDYTGPFFLSCDHGCTHQSPGHTWGASYTECCEWVSLQSAVNNYLPPVHYCSICGDVLIEGSKAHDLYFCKRCDRSVDHFFERVYTGKPALRSTGAKYIISQCLTAILRSDIVFVWLDTLDAYGTLVEMGIAASQSKKIWVASPVFESEMWFAYNLAQKAEEHPTAKQALWNMTADLRKAESKAALIESPIEQMFWDAVGDNLPGLEPQHHIGRYRVDFAIPDRKVVIELDGHEFHKTKEQRTNDAKRERFLQMRGWTVIRFTGSEVYRNATECVREVKEILT